MQFFWGDERCVPPGDEQSNYRMARETLLDPVAVPAENIHRIWGEDNPLDAAVAYERELRGLFPGFPAIEAAPATAGSPPSAAGKSNPESAANSAPFAPVPGTTHSAPDPRTFDLVLLGLGMDGHTASLFPGGAAVHETARWVMPEPIVDLGLWRVTLTPACINAADEVLFLALGQEKAGILRRVLNDPPRISRLPAQAIAPRSGRLHWLVDAEAGVDSGGGAPRPSP